MKVIMVRGSHGGRGRGTRGGGAMSLVASTPEVLTPKEKNKSLGRRRFFWGMWWV